MGGLKTNSLIVLYFTSFWGARREKAFHFDQSHVLVSMTLNCPGKNDDQNSKQENATFKKIAICSCP